MILIETGFINLAKIANLLRIFSGANSVVIKTNPININRINKLEINNKKLLLNNL